MLKTLTTSAAIIALSLQTAAAAPFGASVSASGADRAERSGESADLASFVVNRLVTIVVGKAGHSSDGANRYKYYSDEECEAAKAATDEASEEDKLKKAEPIGPEPIYYGF